MLGKAIVHERTSVIRVLGEYSTAWLLLRIGLEMELGVQSSVGGGPALFMMAFVDSYVCTSTWAVFDVRAPSFCGNRTCRHRIANPPR
jgi:hypothetical protein